MYFSQGRASNRMAWLLNCIIQCVSAAEYRELQNEYRITLRFWSETRALYPPDSWEVGEVCRCLEKMERSLGYTEPPVFKRPPVRAMGF